MRYGESILDVGVSLSQGLALSIKILGQMLNECAIGVCLPRHEEGRVQH